MSHPAVVSAKNLQAEIISSRQAIEETRAIPDSIMNSLVDAQLFRMCINTKLHGLELHPSVCLEVYEILASADAATAWTVWNSSFPSLLGRYLTDDVRAEVFGNGNHKYAISSRPEGTATRKGGHYCLSGRWQLVSGCSYADWVAVAFFIKTDGDFERDEDTGSPITMMAYVPASAYQVIDTWHTSGLKGTGSHDIEIDQFIVPAEKVFTFPTGESHIDQTLGRIPCFSTVSAGHAAICLGIAKAAIDFTIQLGKEKAQQDSPIPSFPKIPRNQFTIAQVTATINGLRSQLNAAMDKLASEADNTSDDLQSATADLWTMSVITSRECYAIVEKMCDMAGTVSLYSNGELDRYHRDIRAALQHITANPKWLEQAGKLQFDMETSNPVFYA